MEKKERLVHKKQRYSYTLLPTIMYLALWLVIFIVLKYDSVDYQIKLTFFLLLLSFCLLLLLLVAYWYFINTGAQINIFLCFIIQNLNLFLFFLLFCNSFLIYLFILEIFAVSYYFFFLNFSNKLTKYSINQYKNFLLFYLWNSFITTMLYGIGIFYLCFFVGTLDFYEIYMLFNQKLNLGITLILISLFWKLGLPGFHFFKVEIYKYLDGHHIFFFSLITVTINLILLFFLVTQPVLLLFLSNQKIYYFIIFTACSIICYYFNIVHLYNFLAWSSVITVFTCLLPLLV